MYLAILGYSLLVLLIVLLLKGKATPMVLFITLPVAIAILAGYDLTTINEYAKSGVATTTGNAILFCFSILFFNMMNDVGVFDPIVNFIVRRFGRNVVGICIATVLVATIGHLDGSSSTTLLITIPFFAPIYKKMKMNPCLLVLLCAVSLGVMNLTPWAGPIARVSVVTGLDSTYLWQRLIPIQGAGIVLSLALAVLYGKAETKKGAGLSPNETLNLSSANSTKYNWKFFLNLILTIATIVILSAGSFTAYVIFMVVTGIAALINYPGQKAQSAIINKFAPAAFFVTATMLASGVFVGILGQGDPSILTEMSKVLLSLLPSFMGRFLHIIMAFLSAPLGLVFGGDAYLYGVLPLCIEVGTNYGITPEAMGLAMVIGKNVAMIGSPVFASTYMAISLADIELKDYLVFAFIPLWIISILMVLSGILFGIIPLGPVFG